VSVILCIMRHGHATGQGATAALRPEGEEYVARLARHLARGGLRPAAAFCSPYRRARETARIVLDELASDAKLTLVRELVPETGPASALEALSGLGLPDGHVLVVSHLPLVAALSSVIADCVLDFQPGAYAEFDLSPDGATGTLRRFIGPDELAAG